MARRARSQERGRALACSPRSTASIVHNLHIFSAQVDLEPFAGTYTQPLLTFITRLSANLRSPERNCVSAVHPSGRSITMFMFAAATTPAVWAALGPNGFVTVSGYDLSAAPAGTPSTVRRSRAAFFEAQCAVLALQYSVTSACQQPLTGCVLREPTVRSCSRNNRVGSSCRWWSVHSRHTRCSQHTRVCYVLVGEWNGRAGASAGAGSALLRSEYIVGETRRHTPPPTGTRPLSIRCSSSTSPQL
jgi:hypothetical protein